MNFQKNIFPLVITVATILLSAGALGVDCNRTKSDEGVFFKSSDAGTGYELATKLANDAELSLGSLNSTTIAIHPQDPSIVYLGTSSEGIYRSIDAGATWTHLQDNAKQMNINANINDIAIDPTNPNTMYVAGYQEDHGHVFKSINKGQSWTKSYVITNTKTPIHALELDPKNSKTIYIGTSEGGILTSQDAGETWRVQAQIDDIVSDIKFHTTNSATIYASTFDSGLLKTTNSGEQWAIITEEAWEDLENAEEVEQITLDAQNPETIYVTSKYGILRSDDGGATWAELSIIPSQKQGVTSLVTHPQHTNILYYGSGSIMYKSVDRGINWSIRDLPTVQEVSTIAIDPKNPNNILVGTREETNN